MSSETKICPKCGKQMKINNNFNSWNNWVCKGYGYGCNTAMPVNKFKPLFEDKTSEIDPITSNEFYKVIDKLELENKRLKEELNNKNCSDCKNNITLDEDIVDGRILKMNIRMLKEEIKILKTNNDHICTGKLPY